MRGKKRGRRPVDPVTIKAAATELFLERGFANTTIEQIAARAGVSPRTVYRYFDTKADLALAETADKLALLRDQARNHDKDAPLGDAIEAIAFSFATYLESDSEFAIRRRQYADDATFNRRRLELIHAETPLKLAHDLAEREGLQEPAPRHLLAARILISILDEAVARWIRDPEGSLPKRVEKLLAEARQLFR